MNSICKILYSHKSLKECVSLIIDNRGKTVPTAAFGIPLIATNCVKEDDIYPSYENIRYVSQETYDTWFRGHPEAGDILFVNKGTPGRVCMVPDPVDFCIAQDMVGLRTDNINVYNKYLYALLRSNFIKEKISALHVGTLIPHFKKGDFEKLILPICDFNIQKLIGDKYWLYCQKIHENLCHISCLINVTQTLYQSWFSDFKYPNTTGKLQGGIPVGWTESNVFDNVTEVREKNKDNHDYPVLSVVKEGEFKLSDDVFTKQVYSKSLTNYKIVRRNQVGYNPARANIGSIAMLTEFEAGLVSPIYIVFEMKDTITPTFFYYYMKQPMFAEGIKHHAIGTTRQNFPFEAFKMFPMIIPPMELQKRFEEIAKPIEQKIAKLKEENAVLAEIRDTLLPKLMSGELPVEVGEV